MLTWLGELGKIWAATAVDEGSEEEEGEEGEYPEVKAIGAVEANGRLLVPWPIVGVLAEGSGGLTQLFGNVGVLAHNVFLLLLTIGSVKIVEGGGLTVSGEVEFPLAHTHGTGCPVGPIDEEEGAVWWSGLAAPNVEAGLGVVGAIFP